MLKYALLYLTLSTRENAALSLTKEERQKGFRASSLSVWEGCVLSRKLYSYQACRRGLDRSSEMTYSSEMPFRR